MQFQPHTYYYYLHTSSWLYRYNKHSRVGTYLEGYLLVATPGQKGVRKSHSVWSLPLSLSLTLTGGQNQIGFAQKRICKMTLFWQWRRCLLRDWVPKKERVHLGSEEKLALKRVPTWKKYFPNSAQCLTKPLNACFHVPSLCYFRCQVTERHWRQKELR